MKLHAILTGLAVTVLALLGLVPGLAANAQVFSAAIIALGLYLALKAIFFKEALVAEAVAEPESEPQPAPPSAPAPADDTVADAAAVTLLGVFQEKGRLIDFLMDDITPYSDAQVGAAARVVHQGCSAALKAHVPVTPVSSGSEGSAVTVPTDVAPDAYRLVGRIAGEPPFTGTLVHKGWQATTVKLPRVLQDSGGQLPVIAPAQVELK